MKLFKTSDVNVKTCQIKIALVDFIENLCHISVCTTEAELPYCCSDWVKRRYSKLMTYVERTPRILVAAVSVRRQRTMMVFLPLHASVLEPRLDLLLAQSDQAGHLQATRSTEVAAEMELFLQLQSLPPAVGRPQLPRLRRLLLQLLMKMRRIRKMIIMLMMRAEMLLLLRGFTATRCNWRTYTKYREMLLRLMNDNDPNANKATVQYSPVRL